MVRAVGGGSWRRSLCGLGGDEDAVIHDVLGMGRWVPGPLLVGDHHPDHRRVADAGEGDVELSVAEARLVEEHADPFEGLSLSFVDRRIA